MPAALPADWPSIRTLYAQGRTLEELATDTGISINTLKARSAREGWAVKVASVAEDKRARAVAVAIQAGQMQPYATSGADLVANALAEMGSDTKLAGMEYAKLVTEHARDRARTEPEKALERSDKVKSALQSAAIAGSWQQQGVQVGVQVNVGGLAVD